MVSFADSMYQKLKILNILHFKSQDKDSIDFQEERKQLAKIMYYQPMEMAALGRPLYLGMLYDCRNDSLIPGGISALSLMVQSVTLWDKKALQEDKDVHRKPKTSLKFSASESLSDKTSLLDVNASLKASFLGGLVEVEGAAKYLHDSESSALQSRVSMHYSQTTRFEQLTMAELGKITYPQVFDHQLATHVVTGVLFGAQAVMVFDQTATDITEKQKIEGNLKVMVEKLPCFSIEGEGKVDMNDEEKNTAKNISVTFHGDCELESNPTTYMEAINVYKTLPQHLKEREDDAVPIRVWLYPLRLLNDKAAMLKREISASLVDKCEAVLEEIGDVERRCNDLIKSTAADNFPEIKDRLQTFRTLYSNYKMEFQKKLQTSLPKVRNEEISEDTLVDYLKAHNNSPFNINRVNEWLENVSTELSILTSYTNELDGIRVATSTGQLNTILFDPGVDAVVCFSFTSLKYPDIYLDELSHYPGGVNMLCTDMISKDLEESEERCQTKQEPLWFALPEISKSMKQNLSLFKSFSKAKKIQERIRLVIASVADPANPGASIQYYVNGKLTDPKFQPVSKPPPPTVKIQRDTVTVTLQKSPCGETKCFRVEYKTAESDVSWDSVVTPDASTVFSFKLPGLPGRNKYLFRYRIVSAVEESEESDSVCAHNECLPVYTLVGGSGGDLWSSLEHDDYGKLRKIAVYRRIGNFWDGNFGMCGMEITFDNNKSIQFGYVGSGTQSEVVIEDGDYFQSLTLLPNKEGDRLGGIICKILRKSGLTENFCCVRLNLGSPVDIDVGSGICGGVTVRHGGDINALGFHFM